MGIIGRPPPAAPIVAIASPANGVGYWLVGADGGVFAFGNVPFYGSLPALGVAPSAPIMGIAPTGDGAGYWLLGANGSIYAFGDADTRMRRRLTVLPTCRTSESPQAVALPARVLSAPTRRTSSW